jgi:hypothetical protein
MAHSASARPTAKQSAAKSPGRRSNIVKKPFRRNIWNSYIAAASISMIAIYGEPHPSAAPPGQNHLATQGSRHRLIFAIPPGSGIELKGSIP